jgi:hypothetical protein
MQGMLDGHVAEKEILQCFDVKGIQIQKWEKITFRVH